MMVSSQCIIKGVRGCTFFVAMSKGVRGLKSLGKKLSFFSGLYLLSHPSVHVCGGVHWAGGVRRFWCDVEEGKCVVDSMFSPHRAGGAKT